MKPLIFVFILSISTLFAGTTTAIFVPNSLTGGPFPTDALTIAAPLQITGRQINLPAASCLPEFAGVTCGNTDLLNRFDGFSINPRTMVCFDGPIDAGTLQGGISYISLDRPSEITGVNQIFYDPATHCAFAKPNAILSQQSRYLLLVTDAVQDASGHKVKESQSFKDCLQHGTDPYCVSLAAAVSAVHGPGNDHIVVGSTFTTMSATTWLEKARRFVDGNEPGVVLPAGLVSVFSIASLSNMTWLPDNSGSGPQDIPLSALNNVDSVAFGLFLSPNFLNVSGPAAGTISDPPTTQPLEAPVQVPGLPPGLPPGFVPVSFHVFLPPVARRPSNGKGFPLVIYGHGLGDSQFGAPTYIASTLASQGFATLAMEIQGHGFGPGGTVQLTDTAGDHFFVAAPGRGIALSNGPIGPADGCIAPGAVAVRDCARQTAVDLAGLVSVLRQTGGLFGSLDPDRIYYIGQSFGALYGTLFHAVEPAVPAAVLNGDGGSSVDIARLSMTGRVLDLEYLASLNPPSFVPLLLNVPPAPPENYFHDRFNDNYPYRDAPPLVNTVPSAPALQAAFESADWTGMPGDALAFAPHLQVSPLSGVSAKKTLFQFGIGDLEVPNPSESAIVRAAGALASTWMFRFDSAFALYPELLGIGAPGLPLLPHRFLSNPTIFSDPAELSIALAAQMQAAQFFNGNPNPDPNQLLTPPFTPGQPMFQVSPPLPEALNFFQIPK